MPASTRITWNILPIQWNKTLLPIPDLKEGIGTIALLQAMDKSLQTGMPVKIKSIFDECEVKI